jgi:hypothetical protein
MITSRNTNKINVKDTTANNIEQEAPTYNMKAPTKNNLEENIGKKIKTNK